MSRSLVATLVAALCSCEGTSTLSLGDPFSAPVTPKDPPSGPVAQGPSLIEPDPALIPPGNPFLPPLAGHRLAVRGSLAAVSDPEGQQSDGRAPAIHLVDIDTSEVRSIALPDGARPGAIELTANGYGFVLLEGSGGVASFKVATAQVTRFFPVCPAPVDLALLGPNVWVACLSGEVVKLEGPVLTRYAVPGVPTRIAAGEGKIHVALSDASVVQIDELGVHAPSRPPAQNLTPTGPTAVRRTAIANSPRRLVALAESGVALLHQQSVEGELVDPQAPATSPYSGGPPTPTSCPTPATRDALTFGDATSAAATTMGSSTFLGTTLPIDLAASPAGTRLAIADAATGRVVLVNRMAGSATTSNGCPVPAKGDKSLSVAGVSSVAFDETGRLVALSGERSLMLSTFDAQGTALRGVVIRSRSVPVGFELFHATPKPAAPTEPNVACASCHPAGMNNGGALTVKGVTHKVMSLGGHLSGAPAVHWDNQPFQTAVIDGTWKTNMQGRALTTVEAASLKAYVEQLQAPAAPGFDAERVQRGSVAFGKAGCGGCHDPSRQFTNNAQADVGRGTHRVPSLVGLAYSAPYMADGCAKTLEERFSRVACGGGESHGHPSALTPDELSALIVFLKTL